MTILNDNGQPKHSPPPPDIETCEFCKFWQSCARQRVVPNGQGGVIPVKDLIAQGQSPKSADVLVIAPCAFSPIWSTVTNDHWCYQFQPEATQ